MEANNREETLIYISRFLHRLGYFDLVEAQDSMNAFIESLTPDQFKNLLVTFNSMLRNLPRKDKEEYKDGKMIVGDWVVPSLEVRDQIIPELLESLKKLETPEERAALLYYSILDLHMFSDGNGRTARFFYNLVMGTDDLMKDIDWYIHTDNNKSTYSGSFEEAKGIMDVSDFNWCASYGLMNKIIEHSGELDPRIKGKSIEVYAGFVQDYNAIPIADHIREQLTKEEIYNINTTLLDRGGHYTVGGATMLIMTSKKEELDKWIEKNEETIELTNKRSSPEDAERRSRRFVFNYKKNKDLFASWTLEDYKEVISIGNELKKHYLTSVMNIFTEPQKHVLDDGTPVIEEVLPHLNKQSSK